MFGQVKIIWTHHAKERTRDRKIPQYLIEDVVRHPSRRGRSNQGETMEYTAKRKGRDVSVVVSEKGSERIIVSCWVEPPFAGSVDIRQKKEWQKYKRAPWWMKWLLTFKKQLFG